MTPDEQRFLRAEREFAIQNRYGPIANIDRMTDTEVEQLAAVAYRNYVGLNPSPAPLAASDRR